MESGVNFHPVSSRNILFTQPYPLHLTWLYIRNRKKSNALDHNFGTRTFKYKVNALRKYRSWRWRTFLYGSYLHFAVVFLFQTFTDLKIIFLFVSLKADFFCSLYHMVQFSTKVDISYRRRINFLYFSFSSLFYLICIIFITCYTCNEFSIISCMSIRKILCYFFCRSLVNNVISSIIRFYS